MNSLYKELRALLAVLTEGDEGLDDVIFHAMAQAGTPVSRSKLQGWRVAESSSHFQRMTVDDFRHVLRALKTHFGVSP